MPDYLLWRLFDAAWRRHDPNLAHDALAEIPHSGAGLPRERALAEAVRWAWREDIDLAEPAAQAYLRGLPGAVSPGSWIERRMPDGTSFMWQVPGALSPVSDARLMIEARVRDVLAAVAAEIIAGGQQLTGVHADSSERVAIDPNLLKDLMGSDRSRDQIRRPGLLITHLGLAAAAPRQGNPGQGTLPLTKTRDEFLRGLKVDSITPGRPGHISWKEAEARAKKECHKSTKGISASRLRARWKELEL
jgi:hypothetical protein